MECNYTFSLVRYLRIVSRYFSISIFCYFIQFSATLLKQKKKIICIHILSITFARVQAALQVAFCIGNKVALFKLVISRQSEKNNKKKHLFLKSENHIGQPRIYSLYIYLNTVYASFSFTCTFYT